MIDRLKIYYPTVSDDVLEAILEEAQEDFTEYCNVESAPITARSLIIAMAKEKLNKIGSEGIESEEFSDVRQTYVTDYTPGIYKRLAQYRRIRRVQGHKP